MPSLALQSYFWAQGAEEPPVPLAGGGTIRQPHVMSDVSTFWQLLLPLLGSFVSWYSKLEL